MSQVTTEASARGIKNEVVGQVVSDKMDKTISVEVFRLVRHPKYGKFIKKSSIFKAHDEKNVAKTGDTVAIEHTRPLSKTKRWKLTKVLESAHGVEL
jgi:small subunit ribosomal protein S17